MIEFKKTALGISAIVKIQENLLLLKSRKGLSWILTIEGRNNVSEDKKDFAAVHKTRSLL